MDAACEAARELGLSEMAGVMMKNACINRWYETQGFVATSHILFRRGVYRLRDVEEAVSPAGKKAPAVAGAFARGGMLRPR
jgi:hypothetical protein